jgi:transcription antitermination factor NusA-like protein
MVTTKKFKGKKVPIIGNINDPYTLLVNALGEIQLYTFPDIDSRLVFYYEIKARFKHLVTAEMHDNIN